MKKHYYTGLKNFFFIGILTTYFFTITHANTIICIQRNSSSMVLMKDTAKLEVDPLNPDYKKDPLKEWENKFTAFKFNVYKKNGHTLPYRTYKPENIKLGKKLPLVLFFHGAGERGLDNRLQFLRFTNTVPFWEKYDCFVLAPQCPPKPVNGPDGESVWVQTGFGNKSHTMKSKPSWPMELSMELLDKFINENNIDTKRIYVVGLSMGGFATWEILQREGNKFAAALPVCGGADLNYAKKMANIPLWVFHGSVDDVVPVTRSRDIIAAITKEGGHPKYTELEGVGHGAWGPTFSKPEVWDWMFAQKKSL